MAVLDSTQFNQLVQEVREALLAGSQGVGEVEIVSSLSNIVSLPALRLVGATESVVEAPLELLSAPAVEAAADARKATDDAVVAAVNAEAAADLSEAERKDLAEIKEQAIKAGADAAAKGDKAFAGAINADNATLYAMQIASYLQTKLEQAQVVILSGKAMQDVIGTLDSRVKDSILICASTREAAYAAILQLRELQKQVAQAIVDAYAVFDQMQLSVADARQATQVAVKAMERICELSERTEQVIVESVIQAGDARLVTVRLETLEKDLLLSKSAADTATRLAHEQADRAKQSADESERLNMDSTRLHGTLGALIPLTEKATADAIASAAAADTATEGARAAQSAAEKVTDNAVVAAAGASVAAGQASEQADKAEAAAFNAATNASACKDLVVKGNRVIDIAEAAASDAKFSAAGADSAAALAREKAGKAEDAAVETLKTKSEADIAAARALDAEQKALDAAKTAENIVSGIRPDYSETDKTSSNYIANKPEIPTLETAPTAGTLTYVNRDGNEVAFRVGDEVRVLEEEEYIFYRLYDLAEDEGGNPVASWDESGSGSRLKTNVYLTGADYLASNIIEQGILKQE